MLEYLKNLAWAGNIRELSNGVARYVLLGPEAAMHQEIPTRRAKRVVTGAGNGEPQVTLKRLSKDAIREMEKNVILETLRANQWNRRKTALALKISYRALIYKIQDAGLVSRRAPIRPVRDDGQIGFARN
jgi:two-component system response regulator AtoC